jgi:hypothetical protein
MFKKIFIYLNALISIILFYFFVYQLTCWINIFLMIFFIKNTSLLIHLLFFIIHHWFCCCKLHQISHWQYIWKLVMAYVLLCTTNNNQLMKNKKVIIWKLISIQMKILTLYAPWIELKLLNSILNYNSFKFHWIQLKINVIQIDVQVIESLFMTMD